MSEPTTTVECPSGLVISIRDAQVRDISRLMSSQKSKKRADPIAEFLGALWVKTIDPGVYDWPGQNVLATDGKPDFRRVLQGDTSFLFLQSRLVTFGDDVYFDVPCKNQLCSKDISWEFKLSELEISHLSDKAIKALGESGNDTRFKMKLPRSGENIEWKLLTRADQFTVDCESEDSIESTNEVSLLVRIPTIESAQAPGDRRRFVRTMSLLDSETLRAEYEEHDIVIQDTIEIQCPRCKTRFETPIPIDRDFFSLRSARPKRSSKQSTKSRSSSDTEAQEEEGSDTVQNQ